MSTAPLSTGVPSWIIGLRFSDRQSSETWPFTPGLSIAGRPPGKGNIDGPENSSPCLDFPSHIGLHSLPRRLIESGLPGLFSFWKKEKGESRKAACVKNRGEIAQRVVFARYFLVFMEVFTVVFCNSREREIWSEIKVGLLGLIFGISGRHFCS